MTRQQEQQIQNIVRNLGSISSQASQPLSQQRRSILRWAADVNSIYQELGNEDAQAKRALQELFMELNRYLEDVQNAETRISARTRNIRQRVDSVERFI